MAMPITSNMLTPVEAAAFLGVEEATMRDWRCSGKGPDFYRITARCIRYDRSDLQRWKSERRVVSSVRHAEGDHVSALQAAS